MDKFIGKRLDGRYEFQELIGMGGMANVYKAFDSKDQKNVAIKVLKEEYQENEEFLRRFRNESKAVAALSHPNIVRIFDVNFGDKIQYIVMELVDGITLKEFMEKIGPLKWKDSVHFTVQILRALQHAHDKGIVHRDIKPQNIMLLEDGTIKVMDFGIARFARDEKKNSEQAVGSVHYISPEQASGDVTDEKSDLYSVGVMMYEMLTGRLPFDGETPEAVAVKQMQAIAELPRSVNEEIPEGLEEIIVRAMQKNAGKRYQSAAEMLRDIDEFKQNPSIRFEYKYFDGGTTKYFDPQSEEEAVEEGKKKSKFIPILIGVAGAFVLITVILILVLVVFSDSTGDVEVDNFIGQMYEDIEKSDEFQKGGKYENIKLKKAEDYNDEKDEETGEYLYPDGTVCAQDPDAGMKIKENAAITLTVSMGAKTLTVPDVTKLDKDEAKSQLVEYGFDSKNIKLAKQESSTVDEGIVISTDPEAGAEISANDTITVYYSAGQPSTVTVPVPSVVDFTYTNAKSTLENAGFVVNPNYVDDTAAAGTVIGQNPKGGASAAKGSTITLTVSNGPAAASSQTPSSQAPSSSNTTETVDVPYVTNMKYAEAEIELAKYGLYAKEIPVTSDQPAGTVIQQSEKAGSSVKAGTTVYLSVSKGPTTTSSE